MIFNSLEFIVFFIFVTLFYFSIGWQGKIWLLLLSSTYFYAYFKIEYLLILVVTIVVDYFAGIAIEKVDGQQRKFYLILSIIANIGFLLFFKYFDFGAENLERFFRIFGLERPIPRMNNFITDFVMPIGLSFHTFQALSYTIEVYRGNQKAERRFDIYALYVLFYPQLVAGPIERPQNVLHQFYIDHQFDYQRFKSGIIQMCWGFFKKSVIADRLSMMVDMAYGTPEQYNGATLLLATFFYTFQIYCDFSGYSDIAIGAARVMGFDLMKNFNAPYFAKSIADFWRRWHISLSTWFRDYLYIPLGGNRVSFARNAFNQFFVFSVSGLWHGAKWTFIIWGALHGFYLIAANFRDKYLLRRKIDSKTKLENSFDVLFTFTLVMLTWVFFRANSLNDVFVIFEKISTVSFHQIITSPYNNTELIFSFFLILILIIKEWKLPEIKTSNTGFFWLIFCSFLIINYLFGVFSQNQFIYFQF